MEKYGVQEHSNKTASQEEETPKCPDCGEKLVDINQTGVLLCPKCGTKPFEE